MTQWDTSHRKNNFHSQGSLSHRELSERLRNPGSQFTWELDSALPDQRHEFPDAYRRKPFLGFRVLQCLCGAAPDSSGFQKAPKPDMRIEQKLHDRSTSHSHSSVAGHTISATIRAVQTMAPN